MRPLLALCLLFLFAVGCTESDCDKGEANDGALEMAAEVTASGDVDLPGDVTK
jgi:hypothetical protein